ncbi:MAG: SUMF1/EgtB/PvdO family nonheme iron enzyme, partial [Oscillospiraceae bacterium]|nr:SUMF1/EgtB/PvdO family nonheme iron enzyme [Oscillospiraceae bacterium]
MKAKQIVKRALDLAMIILLPLLMAEIYTRQELHEWLGAGMAACFIVHVILNGDWLKNLFKSEYSAARKLMTAVNILLCLDVLALLVSGVMMSGFVFAWLNINGGAMFARRLHLFASYWGMIMMSAHLGLNFGAVMSSAKKLFKLEKKNAARTWSLRGIALAASGFGVYAIFSQKIYDYLFLRTHFVMFDETKPTFVFFLETAAMMVLFAAAFYYLQRLLAKIKSGDKAKKAHKWTAFAAPLAVCIAVIIGFNSGESSAPPWTVGDTDNIDPWQNSFSEEVTSSVNTPPNTSSAAPDAEDVSADINDGFVKITGGTFRMGSPETEDWRSDDETLHTAVVSDFFISPFELTQKEYFEITGEDPSNFKGDNLPVENISWFEAVSFCNSLSEKTGLTPVYSINENSVSWNRSANGYRLPTEAEWEYACRAGTTTPFNTENSPSADEANYYGHYPYMIEGNYFTQGNLETKPGVYRQTTLAVDSFSPNKFGLYNMHGNVGEWTWDLYGEYGDDETDPTGAESGILRVYRGGGWNDFAKNMRSAYR